LFLAAYEVSSTDPGHNVLHVRRAVHHAKRLVETAFEVRFAIVVSAIVLHEWFPRGFHGLPIAVTSASNAAVSCETAAISHGPSNLEFWSAFGFISCKMHEARSAARIMDR
jgi:hypothetical protein